MTKHSECMGYYLENNLDGCDYDCGYGVGFPCEDCIFGPYPESATKDPREPEENAMTEQEKYLEGHRNCGIKVGDRVRVTRKAEGYEGGWGNDWEDDMTYLVGETVIVLVDWENYGFRCIPPEGYVAFGFPYFVLEKI